MCLMVKTQEIEKIPSKKAIWTSQFLMMRGTEVNASLSWCVLDYGVTGCFGILASRIYIKSSSVMISLSPSLTSIPRCLLLVCGLWLKLPSILNIWLTLSQASVCIQFLIIRKCPSCHLRVIEMFDSAEIKLTLITFY